MSSGGSRSVAPSRAPSSARALGSPSSFAPVIVIERTSGAAWLCSAGLCSGLWAHAAPGARTKRDTLAAAAADLIIQPTLTKGTARKFPRSRRKSATSGGSAARPTIR